MKKQTLNEHWDETYEYWAGECAEDCDIEDGDGAVRKVIAMMTAAYDILQEFENDRETYDKIAKRLGFGEMLPSKQEKK